MSLDPPINVISSQFVVICSQLADVADLVQTTKPLQNKGFLEPMGRFELPANWLRIKVSSNAVLIDRRGLQLLVHSLPTDERSQSTVDVRSIEQN